MILENISASVPYEIRVASRFKMDRMIGSGSFGEIYSALDVSTGTEVACKIENANTKRPQVIEESKLLKVMQGTVGFPKFIHYGQEGPFSVMVLEMLGPSLEDLYNFCGRKLSLKTVLQLADQLLDRIQTLHERGYIHRDLKPENMLMGLDDGANTLFLIDFGLAKKWKLSNGLHIPYKDGKNLTGTARYVSHFTHNGIEQSRRDDLEGIGYILLYLLMGQLPW
jgi:casein kinase 1